MNYLLKLIDKDISLDISAKTEFCDSVTLDDHGLSEYLAGIDAEPAFAKTNVAGLTLLPSGAKSMNAAGLISSRRMEKLLEICDEQFDYVIFDCPPVNVVSDALLLVKSVDGYIISTRSDYSNINAVSEAVDAIGNVGGNILGCVLTGANPKKSYMYGGYSEYGEK